MNPERKAETLNEIGIFCDPQREVRFNASLLSTTGKKHSECLKAAFDTISYDEPLPISTGRGRIWKLFLPNIGAIIIRKYFRGGFVRYFNRDRYLKNPLVSSDDLRPFQEFSILHYLREAGASVPTPVFATVEHSNPVSYRGYLATIEIPNAKNFLDLLQSNTVTENMAERERWFQSLAFETGKEISRVLDAGVYHPDFHLGNVLVDQAGKVFLIDFDRGHFLKESESDVNRRLGILLRWKRSTHRHHVSAMLDRPFEKGLYERSV